jgi:hypothetical protein
MKLKLNKKSVSHAILEIAYLKGIMPRVDGCGEKDPMFRSCYATDGLYWSELSDPCWMMCPLGMSSPKLLKLALNNRSNKRLRSFIDKINEDADPEAHLTKLYSIEFPDDPMETIDEL